MTHDLRGMIIAYRLHTCYTSTEYKILIRYFNYNEIRLRSVTASTGLTNKRVTRVNVTKIITVKSRTFCTCITKSD